MSAARGKMTEKDIAGQQVKDSKEKEAEHLNKEMFLNDEQFRCPICRGECQFYNVIGIVKFYTSKDSFKYAVFIECHGCKKISMHFISGSETEFIDGNFQYVVLSYESYGGDRYRRYQCVCKSREESFVKYLEDIEALIYNECKCINEHYIDTKSEDFKFKTGKKVKENFLNIHKCRKQNILAGACVYIRKTLEEIFVDEDININNKKIRDLVDDIKEKYPNIDSGVIDTIKDVYKISSDTIHGDSVLDLNEERIDILTICLEQLIKSISNAKEEKESTLELKRLAEQLNQSRKKS